MDYIRRIRPQSKRKAVRAAFFAALYFEQSNSARADGRAIEVSRLLDKHNYWQAKYDALTARKSQ